MRESLGYQEKQVALQMFPFIRIPDFADDETRSVDEITYLLCACIGNLNFQCNSFAKGNLGRSIDPDTVTIRQQKCESKQNEKVPLC